jgi:hypothetical protein
MSETLKLGEVQHVPEHLAMPPPESEERGLFDRLRNKWSTVAAIGATVLSIVVGPNINEQPAYAANTEHITVGMPFAGRWAYSSNVEPDSNGKYSDETSSHPSVHDNHSADWGTDIYALPGTEAKLKVNGASGNATYSVSSVTDTSCGAGKRVRVAIKVDDKNIGWVQYDHLDTALANGDSLQLGGLLGKTKNWGNLSCYRVSSNAGVHLHVGLKNTEDNHSCYADQGNPGKSLSAGDKLGVIGSPSTDIKQSCASNSTPSTLKPQDLAWWTGSILNTRPNPGFEISSATDGLAPPYWADVMDHNGDGLDDIVLFRENGGDIKIIRKNPNGGWTPVSEAVRGPNIAPPLWAATADLDNNGKDNDLIWWSANGISKLVGEDLNTKSTTTGIAAPNWADVIDYNQDGRDDIVLLRPDGSLRVLLNSANGGWNAAAPNPVRTGVTQPVWAGVGDFNGDGKAREIAWWNASGNVSILDGADKFKLVSTTGGITPPEWADVTDYDGDGKDDIVFYRDGTINILRKSPTGDGFYSHTENPIRGPGVVPPSWGAVGDFS